MKGTNAWGVPEWLICSVATIGLLSTFIGVIIYGVSFVRRHRHVHALDFPFPTWAHSCCPDCCGDVVDQHYLLLLPLVVLPSLQHTRLGEDVHLLSHSGVRTTISLHN